MPLRLSRRKIRQIARQIWENASIKDFYLMEGGVVNRNYCIETEHPEEKIILRINPFVNYPGKFEKEALIYRLIERRTDVPVPQIYFIDSSKELLPFDYMLMSRIEGKNLGDVYDKLPLDIQKTLATQAGEYLAKINSIKFDEFGFIDGKGISEGRNSLREHYEHHLRKLLTSLANSKEIQKITPKINSFIEKNIDLLCIKTKPCLVHYDYHFENLMTNGERITGILDVEWARATHNEQDLILPEWWIFHRFPQATESFLEGYKKFGSVSHQFIERKKLYQVQILLEDVIGSVLSQKSRHRIRTYFNRIEKIIAA